MKNEEYPQLKYRYPKSCIRYISSDGEKFTDYHEFSRHEFKLNLLKLEAIGKRSWVRDGSPWIFLGIFVAGYIWGWICTS